MTETRSKEPVSPDSGRITLRYRPYRPGDETAVLECLREEYGDTYYRPGYYDPAYYPREIGEGRMAMFIGEESGSIAGFLTIRKPEYLHGQVELGTMILRKSFRGKGFSTPFIRHAMEALIEEKPCSLFGHTQLFHAISQKDLFRLGLVPCGIMLSVIQARTLHHSYDEELAEKLSWGVMSRSISKEDAGDLYIPEELRRFIEPIYASLGVRCRRGKAGGSALPCGVQSVHRDHDQAAALVVIDKFGSDTAQSIRAVLAEGSRRPGEVVNVLLNCADKSAISGYRALEQMGFFCTGVQPCAWDAEYLILHHPLSTANELAKCRFIPEYEAIKSLTMAGYARYEARGKARGLI